MKRSWICLPAGMVMLFGCANDIDVQPSGPYSIAGHATLTMEGSRKPCEDITLVPVNETTSKAMASFLARPAGGFAGEVAFRDVEAIPDYEKISHRVDCDASGGFKFQNVGDGNYYLVARVTWLLRLAHRGGFVIRPMTVSASMEGLEVSLVH